MEENKSYFGEIGHALKTLAIGMGVTWKEYFKDFLSSIPKTVRRRCMLLSVIVAAWYSSAMRMVPTSVPPVRCVRSPVLMAPSRLFPTCRKILRRERRRRCSTTISTTWATVCSVSCVPMPAISMLSSLPTISRMPSSTARSWCSILTRRSIREVPCLIC